MQKIARKKKAAPRAAKGRQKGQKVMGRRRSSKGIIAAAIHASRDYGMLQSAFVESERKNQALLGAIPDSLFQINLQGRITSYGQGKSCGLSFTPEHIIGCSFASLFGEEQSLALQQAINVCHATGQAQTVDARVSLDGKDKDIEIRLVAMDGLDEGSLALVRDVSDKKSMERELMVARQKAEVANMAKSAFLASVSHELRTPLNAILGFSEVIKNQTFGAIKTQKYVEYADYVHSSGQDLLRMINSVLDFANLESQTATLSDDILNVDELIEDVGRTFERQGQDNDIHLRYQLEESLPLLRGDRRALKQILSCLLSNALKFSRAGGEITITTHYETGKGIIVAVSDQGAGIDAEHLARVTEPFSRGSGDAQTARPSAGIGLGLTLAQSLMRLHAGNLHVRSIKDMGTTVILQFPVWRCLSNDVCSLDSVPATRREKATV